MIFQNYYRGNFNSKCSAAIVYDLSIQLNKESREMLWWLIVGFTDLMLHQKIDTEL